MNSGMLRRRVGAVPSLAVVTWWVSALVPACLSPTLPVPPPNAPQELQEPLAQLLADGRTIQVSGSDAEPGALINLWNEDTQRGAELVKSDSIGRYETMLDVDLSCAVPRNHVALWQTTQDGYISRIRTYRLPNMFGAALPPESAVHCNDAGQADAGTSVVGVSQNTAGNDVDEGGRDGTVRGPDEASREGGTE